MDEENLTHEQKEKIFHNVSEDVRCLIESWVKKDFPCSLCIFANLCTALEVVLWHAGNKCDVFSMLSLALAHATEEQKKHMEEEEEKCE